MSVLKKKKFSRDGIIIVCVIGVLAITQGAYLLKFNQRVSQYSEQQTQASNLVYQTYETTNHAILKNDDENIKKQYSLLTSGNTFSLSLAGLILKRLMTQEVKTEISPNTLTIMKEQYTKAIENPKNNIDKDISYINTIFDCAFIDIICQTKGKGLKNKIIQNYDYLNQQNKNTYQTLKLDKH